MTIVKINRIAKEKVARKKLTQVGEVTMQHGRGSGVDVKEFDLPDQHIIEAELENGLILFRRADEIGEVSSDRSGSGGTQLVLPQSLDQSGNSRGLGAFAVRTYRFFSGSGLGEKAAYATARKLEQKPRELDGWPYKPAYRDKDVLLPLMRDGGFGEIDASLATRDGAEILVLIHGTASSTMGSFGPIVHGKSDGTLSPGTTSRTQWERLCKRFKDPKDDNEEKRCLIYGFEHHTLTRSPVQNAIALLEAIPRNARLHMLSHSRGGLVGELLCLLPDTLDKDDLDRYANAGLPRDDLDKFKQLMAFKAPQVQQFVRVAAPMQGTLLNSDRIDTTFSLLFNLMKIVPGGQNVLADAFREFAREFIATREDVSVLPGLAAMSPESALVAILNRANRTIESPLTVVSGDIEPAGILKSLAVFATDLFYREDHDVVVHTRAMLKGVPRKPDLKVFPAQGSDVNHFSYFSNKMSSKVIVDALTGVENPNLEAHAPEPEAMELISGTRGSGADKPLVFVLPGIMGSHLRVRGQDTPIWFNLPRILTGELKKITSKDGEPIEDVEPAGVLKRFYGGLVRHLSRSHEVAVFDFDWRKPLQEEADRLAARVQMELSKIPNGETRPIRFVAHSMGGLVVRLMINRHRELWEKLRSDAGGGSTLVMLGTPNRGSMSIVWALMGLDKMIHTIDRIDWKHDVPELVEKMVPLQGILELLPTDGDGAYFKRSTWQQLRNAKGPSWPLPESKRLKNAAKTYDELKLIPNDAPAMSYIAGNADMTPAALDSTTLKMTGSRHGDGRVLWRTGLLPDVSTWYAYETSHGDLARDRDLFGPILDLLQTGRTNGLPQTPPVERSGAPLFEVVEPELLYPSNEDAEAAIIGATGANDLETDAEKRDPCKVSVMHGDLRLHNSVVTVGRYEHEPMEGVERDIDEQLDGQLTQRRALGIYPGQEGTAELFLRKQPVGEFATGIDGALVAGLGRVSELSRRRLSVTLANAFVLYALRTGPVEKDGAKTLTTLPISSNDSQLSIADSVESILVALQNANNRLPRDHRITHLTILELYEDRAIEVGSALSRMEREGRWKQDFKIDCNIRNGLAGRQRFRFGPDTSGNRRMQITVPENDTESLDFVVFDRGALAQRVTTRVKRSRIDSLIHEATASSHTGPDTGKLLYEWVIPKELRAKTSDKRNMTFQVDEAAAAYPWEMLQDNWGEGGKPVAVEAQVTRQLIRRRSGLGSNIAASRRVLVIGDPVSFFSELKGAQAEARLVADKLGASGWTQDMDVQIRENVDVERALTLEENQILHFAGHGVFEWGDNKQTGLITGKKRVLEPAFIEKLRYVPEFVFLNCCYGGAIGIAPDMAETSDEERDPHTPRAALANRPDLASGIAMKFIEAGSKAVIAAGWAVNDGMAQLFATTFYDAFLNGYSFAEAVRLARAKVYEKDQDGNTWSAYQTYGDPEFRLQRGVGAHRPDWVKPEFVSPRQATLTLRSLKLDARFAPTAQQTTQVAKQFMETLRVVNGYSEWSRNPELFEAIADVCAELGDYKSAIEYYERAVRRSPPTLSLNALENLMSLRVRVDTQTRIEKQQGSSKREIEKARKKEEETIRAAIDYLVQQEKIAGERSAALRQTRIGDGYLRLSACAFVGSPTKATTIDYLERARGAYDTAVTCGFQLPEFDTAYPLIRRALADFLLSCASDGQLGHSIDELMPVVNRVAQDIRETDAQQTQFQRRRLIAETRLFELVSTDVYNASLQGELLDVFGQLFLDGGSIRRRREVVSDLYTVAQLLSEVGKQRTNQLDTTVGETVRSLARELENGIPKVSDSILNLAEEI